MHRIHFFVGQDANWNIFEFLLVVQSLSDYILVNFVDGEGGAQLMMVRVLRVLRISRLFRVFRLFRFMRDLRNIMVALVNSVSILAWALIAISLFVSFFSVVILQMVNENIARLNNDDKENLAAFFNGFACTAITLLQATTGGQDWKEIYDAAGHGGPFLQAVFVFFVFSYNIAVFNIVSGLFIEKALASSEPDRLARSLDSREKDLKDAQHLLKALINADEDGTRRLDVEKFKRYAVNCKVHASLVEMDIIVRDHQSFFDFIADISGKNEITFEEFARICARMKGDASAADMATLSHEIKTLRSSLEEQRPAMSAYVSQCRSP